MNIEAKKSILLSYKMLAKLDQLSFLAEAVEKGLLCYPNLIYAVNLCLEELITNTILYGLKDKSAEIEINIYLNNETLEIVIEDEAPAFNPFLSVQEPNVNASLEDRVAGGLGIFFVKKFMDNYLYQRRKCGNQISMFKNID